MILDNPVYYVCIRPTGDWLEVPAKYFVLDMMNLRDALIQYVPKQRLGSYRDVHQLGVL